MGKALNTSKFNTIIILIFKLAYNANSRSFKVNKIENNLDKKKKNKKLVDEICFIGQFGQGLLSD